MGKKSHFIGLISWNITHLYDYIVNVNVGFVFSVLYLCNVEGRHTSWGDILLTRDTGIAS